MAASAVYRSPPTKRFHRDRPPWPRKMLPELTTSLYTNCSIEVVLGVKSAKEDVRSATQKPSTLRVGVDVGIVEGRADGSLVGFCVGRGVRATPSGKGEEVVGILVVGALEGSENGCLEG